jgi:DNA-binding Lrp family transcriptional regulator
MRFAYILIKAESGKIRAVADQLAEMEEVSEVHSISGPYDILTKVRVEKYEDLGDLVPGKFQKISGIRETNTFLVFNIFK